MIDIAKIVLARIESPEPQASILEELKKHEGEEITHELVDSLNVAVPGYFIRLWRTSDATYILWRDGGDKGTIVVHREKNLRDPEVIDTKFIEEENAELFTNLRRRNVMRLESLADPRHVMALNIAIASYIQLDRIIRKFTDPQSGLYQVDREAIMGAIESAIKEERG